MREKEVHDKVIRRTRMETVMERQTFQPNTVSYGSPVMAPCLIPVIHASTPSCINERFMVEGETYYVTSFSLQGSFGAVITNSIDTLDVSSIGGTLSTHPLFPLGADIVFVEIEHKDMIKARLYHKGEGEVSFSERGACAAFVAARILDKTYGSSLVAMGNKTCRVEWDGVDGEVSLSEIKSI